jgi:hypothetical protein
VKTHRSPALCFAALAALLPIAAPGCAPGTTRSGAPAAEALRPLSVPVTRVSGDVEVRAPAAGQAAAEIRAQKGGAVVLGTAADPRAKLWLKADSTVAIAEDGRGRVLVEVTRGEARARAFDDRAKIAVGSGKDARDATRDDVILRVGEASAVPAAEEPAAADWTLEQDAKKAPPAAGIGSLTARDAEDKTVSLALRSVQVSAELAGDVAETRVEHVFHNAGTERLEGTFRFPLPEEASLVGLSMEIDGRMMEGELVETEKARKTYESIVDEMRDPALLEWEHGSTFKLRVFPIEPSADKRIVIRYVAPLRRELGHCSYVYPTAAADLAETIPAFRLDVAGKRVVDAKGYRPGGEIAVPLAEAQCPATSFEERRPDGIYTAVHVRPSWPEVRAALPAAKEPAARIVIVVADTSRSTLESRPLQLDTLGAVLGELGPRDRFVVVASDVTQADHDRQIVPATEAARAAARRFVEGIEPDGASDLGAALRHAGKLAEVARAADAKALVQVVYIGDGAPTWGETDAAALRKVAAESLGETPLYAVLLGGDVKADLFADLTGLRGGFVARPRSPEAAHRFALQLAHAREVAAIAHVTLDAGEGRTVAPLPAATLVEGEDLVAVVRTPAGGAPPSAIKLHGKVGEREVDLSVPVPAASPQKHVARRWAAAEIAALEREPDKKDEIVKLSLDYQVMSKKTSFLVLESEEAYARYQIERKSKAKQQQADGKPAVTGGDLESLARGAQMGMDRIQPGDPEIHIAAPADAASVVVVFPFGETKVASFDPETHAWVVRFLIDEGTPDGTYKVTVRITHRDGHVELTSVPYVVDTLKPAVTMSIRPAGVAGQFEIRATQVIGEAEVASALAPAERKGTVAQLLHKYPERIADVRRVDVRLEDGTVLPLEMVRPGEMRALWSPKEPPSGSVKLHVVAIDKALNQSAFDVEVTPEAP